MTVSIQVSVLNFLETVFIADIDFYSRQTCIFNTCSNLGTAFQVKHWFCFNKNSKIEQLLTIAACILLLAKAQRGYKYFVVA
jgi:hypothetical protein